MTDDEDTGDYESGPFCVHWSEGCEEMCACGHPCRSHDIPMNGESGECLAEGCACQGWTKPTAA